VTIPNTDLSVEQLRKRLLDRISHLQSRVKDAPVRLRPHMENEIKAYERRLKHLNEKASGTL
jgi:hypothetical protein